MALTVETGAGLSNADSYASVASADTYFSNYGEPSEWTAASTALKEQTLRIATQTLDGKYEIRFSGIRSVESQALAWPRLGAENDDGLLLASDVIPPQVIVAMYELARKQIVADIRAAYSEGRIKREMAKVGPIETDVEYVGGKLGTAVFEHIDTVLQMLLIGSSAAGRVDRA